MKYFIYAIIIILGLGLEIALFSEFSFLHTAPNLLLLFTLYIAARQPGYGFVFLAIISGLVTDLLIGVPVGTFLLGFLALSGVAHMFFGSFVTIRFDWKYVPLVALAGSMLLLLWISIYITLFRILAMPVPGLDWPLLISKLLPMILTTAVFMYPVYWFTEAVTAIVDRFEMRKKGYGV